MFGRSLGTLVSNCLGLLLLAAALAANAAAQDEPPFLLAEPTEFTNVLDAFEDPSEPVEFSVRLTFVRTQRDDLIERERPGTFELGTLDVAHYHSVRSELIVGADVGLYRDLMIYGRLPLVFSDTRSLRWPDAAQCDSEECVLRRMQVARALRDPAPGMDPAASGRQLFDLGPNSGLDSATRSGVPAIDLGLAWGITNQYRTPHLPTWVVLLESRIGIGDTLEPCLGGGCDPGISRGTVRAQLESRWSYRYRVIEPFLGLAYALEWATSASASEAFAPGDDAALVDTALPSVAGVTVGAAIVPWEQRARFQQLAIDVRGRAEYVSAGRDYTPLFDALGRSENPYLSEPQLGASGPIPFTGLTQVDAYARLELDLSLVIRAARYVRFRLGMVLSHATDHLLTSAASCSDRASSEPAAGRCGDLQPNPLYRGVLDQPGQRFIQKADLQYSLSATATGEF